MVQTPNRPNVKRCSFWDFLVPKDSKGSLCSLFKFSNCQRLRVYIARYNVTLFSIVRVIDKGPQSVTNCLSPYGENIITLRVRFICVQGSLTGHCLGKSWTTKIWPALRSRKNFSISHFAKFTKFRM